MIFIILYIYWVSFTFLSILKQYLFHWILQFENLNFSSSSSELFKRKFLKNKIFSESFIHITDFYVGSRKVKKSSSTYKKQVWIIFSKRFEFLFKLKRRVFTPYCFIHFFSNYIFANFYAYKWFKLVKISRQIYAVS